MLNFSLSFFLCFHLDEPMESSKPSNVALITGAIVGSSIVLILLIFAGIYAFYQKKRAEKAIFHSNPFGKTSFIRYKSHNFS